MHRLAIASSGLGHVNRGIETWSKNLAYLLYSKGIDITLFKGGGKKESEIEKIIHCPGMNSRIMGGVNSPLSWGFRHVLQQKIFSAFLIPRLRDFDIIQTSDYRVGKALQKTKKKGLLKGRVIFTDGNMYRIELLKEFEYVHELSSYYVKEAKKKSVNTDKWFVIPNFVDTEEFKHRKNIEIRRKLGISPDAFLILSVGVIDYTGKRMNWIINEVKKLNKINNKIELLVVGEKELDAERLVNYGKETLGKNFHFMFNLPYNRMPDIYNIGDVFVLGSLKERFPMAVIEAMACELPVITHPIPVLAEILGEGGETIDMTKEGLLADTLMKYMKDDEFRIKKGKNARRRVKKHYSTNAVLPQFLKMYNRVMEL